MPDVNSDDPEQLTAVAHEAATTEIAEQIVEIKEQAAAPPMSRARKVRSIVIRVLITVLALGISAVLLVTVFDDLDWSSIWEAITSLSDAEMISLIGGTALVYAAQGLVTASTMPGLPVRRGVIAYLGPAAVAAIVPGPSDLPVRYRMYDSWGYGPQAAGLAVVSSGIFSIGTKLILPVLAAIVALIAGVELSGGVGGTIVVAGVVLGALIVLTGVVLGSPRFAHAIGRWLQAPWTIVTKMLRKQTEPLPIVLTTAREKASTLLADRWPIASWAALLLTMSQLGLMLLAVRSTGVPESDLTFTEIFVAYGIVAGLTVLPITAGNVGVSETAWIALLGAMAGSSHVNQVTAAVLIYRILTWLAVIPLGGIAMLLWRRSVAHDARRRAEQSKAPA